MESVTITTATKLSPASLKKIKATVEKKYGSSVTYHQVVDPSIIGGVSLLIGSMQLDGTLRHQLDQIKQKLAEIN